MPRVRIKTSEKSFHYEIEVGSELDSVGSWAVSVLRNNPRKIALISNRRVHSLYGRTVEKSLIAAGFEVVTLLIGDGERFKNFRTLKSILDFLSENRLSRSDSLVALGGGVVGDLVGFAASIYLRGISFVQIPTTLLAMIDSSVGGKTGINSEFGKNLIGSFYQPSGVFIDTTVLSTLPTREGTAGFCEAVKHGAISGRKLFERTADFLRKYPDKGTRFGTAVSEQERVKLLVEQISFKAMIVACDERERLRGTGRRSRKILNFGHTLAHALEKATGYRYLRHGEAVGHGILFAAALSKKLGLLPSDQVELLNDVVHRAGSLPDISRIEPQTILESLKFDKKVIGNSLQWILLESIGKPQIVNDRDIPKSALLSTLRKISES